MITRTSRRSTAFLLASLLTLVLPIAVLGHAELDTSDPAEGSTVDAPFDGPIVMTFTEDLASASKAELIDGAGKVASTSIVDGMTMTLTPDAALEEGEYEVRWTSVADDGHIERGTVRFIVAAAAATAAPTATPTPPPTPTPAPVATPSPSAAASPSASPGTSPSAAPSVSPSAAVQPSATPAASAPVPSGGTDAGSPSSGGDVLLPIIAGALLVGALAFILLRRRDATPPPS